MHVVTRALRLDVMLIVLHAITILSTAVIPTKPVTIITGLVCSFFLGYLVFFLVLVYCPFSVCAASLHYPRLL